MFSWIYNRTNGSILPVAIFHASMNSMNPLMDIYPITKAGNIMLFGLAIIAPISDRIWQKLPKNHPAVYQYLNDKGKFNEAIEIFEMNVADFPESFNVYGSLGETYMKSGKKELAIVNFQKSLILNPKNENAKNRLEELKTK